MKHSFISPEILHQLLIYKQNTGLFFWKERPRNLFANNQSYGAWNTKYAGKEAFNGKDGKGYFRGCIFNKKYLSHRVAWAMETGAWPKDQIDHINHIRNDNRFENLREASPRESLNNTSSQTGSSSKFLGVYWDNHNQKWVSKIRTHGRRVHIGSFDDEISAARAYDEAAIKYHGIFANPNFSTGPEVTG